MHQISFDRIWCTQEIEAKSPKTPQVSFFYRKLTHHHHFSHKVSQDMTLMWGWRSKFSPEMMFTCSFLGWLLSLLAILATDQRDPDTAQTYTSLHHNPTSSFILSKLLIFSQPWRMSWFFGYFCLNSSLGQIYVVMLAIRCKAVCNVCKVKGW